MAEPKVLKIGSDEMKKLEAACAMLNAFDPERFTTGRIYEVENIYFDFGQEWMWTTITAYEGERSWQILNPRDWGYIIEAGTPEKIAETVTSILNK